MLIGGHRDFAQLRAVCAQLVNAKGLCSGWPRARGAPPRHGTGAHSLRNITTGLCAPRVGCRALCSSGARAVRTSRASSRGGAPGVRYARARAPPTRRMADAVKPTRARRLAARSGCTCQRTGARGLWHASRADHSRLGCKNCQRPTAKVRAAVVTPVAPLRARVNDLSCATATPQLVACGRGRGWRKIFGCGARCVSWRRAGDRSPARVHRGTYTLAKATRCDSSCYLPCTPRSSRVASLRGTSQVPHPVRSWRPCEPSRLWSTLTHTRAYRRSRAALGSKGQTPAAPRAWPESPGLRSAWSQELANCDRHGLSTRATHSHSLRALETSMHNMCALTTLL